MVSAGRRSPPGFEDREAVRNLTPVGGARNPEVPADAPIQFVM
jgi:hypothetical protein